MNGNGRSPIRDLSLLIFVAFAIFGAFGILLYYFISPSAFKLYLGAVVSLILIGMSYMLIDSSNARTMRHVTEMHKAQREAEARAQMKHAEMVVAALKFAAAVRHENPQAVRLIEQADGMGLLPQAFPPFPETDATEGRDSAPALTDEEWIALNDTVDVAQW